MLTGMIRVEIRVPTFNPPFTNFPQNYLLSSLPLHNTINDISKLLQCTTTEKKF